MTSPKQCFKPLPIVIDELNQQMRGWATYFSKGYPRMAFRHINGYARLRLTRHAQRRSQRGYRPPKGRSYYEHFQNMGLIYL
jgi:RNA-directed DNA polymerase